MLTATNVHSGSLSWTQTLSPRLATQVTYELAYASGLQASPYRYVPVRVAVDAAPDFWVPETDPDTRFRHALVLAGNRAVGGSSAIQGDYRIYRELSPLWSETLGAKLAYRFSDRVEGELKLDAFYYAYADFAPLASRTGANLGAGIALSY